MVSADVKHHVYLLTYETGIHLPGVANKCTLYGSLNNMGGHGKLMVSMTTVTTMTWVAVANSWFL